MLCHFGKQPSIPQNLNKEARRSSPGELLKEDEDVSTQKNMETRGKLTRNIQKKCSTAQMFIRL